jgi:hypothetical protein
MERFEYEGFFWPADEPDKKIAGRLSYNPTEGASLNLFGAFDEPMVALNVTGSSRRILGVAGSKDLTLDGCLPRGTNVEGSQGSALLIRQEYYVPLVLEGAQISADDTIEFDSVTLEFDQLPFWTQKARFTPVIESDQLDISTAAKYTMMCEVPVDEIESTDDVEVRLSSNSSIGSNRVTEGHLSWTPCLKITYPERRGLDGITTDIYGVQDLMTLAMDAPAVPTRIQLRRSDFTAQLATGKEYQIPIDAFWLFLAEHVKQEKPTGNAMFFSFDQVGGVQTIARWLAVSQRYRLVLGLLLTIRYSQRMYQENRFTNVISAAETLHRMRFPNEVMPTSSFKSYKRKIAQAVKITLGVSARNWINEQLAFSNEPRLRGRLLEVAKYAGPEFGELVGDVEIWSRIVTLLRNRLTHHDPNQEIDRQPGDLDYATESIYIMVMIALLRECNVPPDTLAKFQLSRRVKFLRERLLEMTPRLAKYIRR